MLSYEAFSMESVTNAKLEESWLRYCLAAKWFDRHRECRLSSACRYQCVFTVDIFTKYTENSCQMHQPKPEVVVGEYPTKRALIFTLQNASVTYGPINLRVVPFSDFIAATVVPNPLHLITRQTVQLGIYCSICSGEFSVYSI